MSSRSISAEVTISDGTRRLRKDFGVVQLSPRKWRSGDWRGYGASDFTKEADARKAMAARLREWADHIEKTPFPADAAGAFTTAPA